MKKQKIKLAMIVIALNLCGACFAAKTNLDPDAFISFGNVAVQGLNSGCYNNIRQYCPDGSGGTNTSPDGGYIMVGNRYQVRHMNANDGFAAVPQGASLSFQVTDTKTGITYPEQLVVQTFQGVKTQRGAIWTIRALCTADGANVIYEFLTPGQNNLILGTQYDFNKMFGANGINDGSVLGTTTYSQQVSTGTTIGVINIGNVENSTASFNNTDLVAVVCTDTSHHDYVNAYLLNYSSVMMGPKALELCMDPNIHPLNTFSGSGTVDVSGNFGALLGFGVKGKNPTSYFIPVVSSGMGFGEPYARNYNKGSDGSGNIIMPSWSTPDETSILQSWAYTTDTKCCDNNDLITINFSSKLCSTPSSMKNMGYVLRNGNDTMVTQEINSDYKISKPSQESDQTSAMGIGIIMGLPPGYYFPAETKNLCNMNVESANCNYTNNITSGFKTANTISASNGRSVSISIPCKYGSVGGSAGTSHTDNYNTQNTVTMTTSNPITINNLNTIGVSSYQAGGIFNYVWFVGAQGNVSVHYADETQPQTGKYPAFPVIKITSAAPSPSTYNTDTELPNQLKGFDFPSNNLTPDNSIASYSSKIKQITDAVENGQVIKVDPDQSTWTEQASNTSQTSEVTSWSAGQSNMVSQEHGVTNGWSLNLGKELSFSDTVTKNFTTSSTNSLNNQVSIGFEYGPPSQALLSSMAGESLVKCSWRLWYINVARYKMFSKTTPLQRPWFISKYMWDNEINFWLFGYLVNTGEKLTSDT